MRRRYPDFRDEHRESLIMLGNAVTKRTLGAMGNIPFARHFVVMLAAA